MPDVETAGGEWQRLGHGGAVVINERISRRRQSRMCMQVQDSTAI